MKEGRIEKKKKNNEKYEEIHKNTTAEKRNDMKTKDKEPKS